MYVCNCNGVRERDADRAIAAGAMTPRAVLRACGVDPQCGRCLPELAARIKSAAALDAAADADYLSGCKNRAPQGAAAGAAT
jgi:bacterioferritin-associated ferredoxin